MALLLAVLLGVFAALSAVVVPTTGRYHTRYAIMEVPGGGDFEANQLSTENNYRGNFPKKHRRHLPVLLHVAVAAASLAVVLAVIQCFRQLSSQPRELHYGFSERRLATGGEDPCKKGEEEAQEEEAVKQALEAYQEALGEAGQEEAAKQALEAYQEALGEAEEEEAAQQEEEEEEAKQAVLDAYQEALAEAQEEEAAQQEEEAQKEEEEAAKQAVDAYQEALQAAADANLAAAQKIADWFPWPSFWGLLGSAAKAAQRISEAALRGPVLPRFGAPWEARGPSTMETIRNAAGAHIQARRAAERATICLSNLAATTRSESSLDDAIRHAVEDLILLRAENLTSPEFRPRVDAPPTMDRPPVPQSTEGTRRAGQALQRAADAIGGPAGAAASRIATILQGGGGCSDLFLGQAAISAIIAAAASGKQIPPLSMRKLKDGVDVGLAQRRQEQRREQQRRQEQERQEQERQEQQRQEQERQEQQRQEQERQEQRRQEQERQEQQRQEQE